MRVRPSLSTAAVAAVLITGIAGARAEALQLRIGWVALVQHERLELRPRVEEGTRVDERLPRVGGAQLEEEMWLVRARGLHQAAEDRPGQDM